MNFVMWFLIIHWSKNKRKLLNLKLIHFIPWKTFKEGDLQDYHIKGSEIQEVGKFRLGTGCVGPDAGGERDEQPRR